MRKHLTSRHGLVALEEEAIAAAAAEPTPELDADGNPVVPAEGAAPAAEPVVIVEEPIGENADSLETDLIEVAEDTADVEAAETEVAETVEVAEDLEEVATALEAAALNGGIDKHSAAVVKIAVNKLYKRAGVRSAAMPAMESFGGTGSRVRATQLAMEDIKENIKRIWAAIVAQITRAIEWMADFFERIFVAARKLKERALKLKAKSTAVGKSTSGKKEADFENEKLATALAINGSVAAKPTAGLTKVVSLADEIFNGEALGVAMVEGAIKELDAIKSNPKAILEQASGKMTGIIGSKKSSTDGFAELVAGTEMYSSEELPGGKAVITIVAAEGLKGAEREAATKAQSSKVEYFKGSKAAAANKKIATLEFGTCEEIADEVVKLADALLKYKQNAGKTKDAKKKLAAAGKACGDAAAKATDETDKKGFALGKVIFTNAASCADQPGAQFAGYALNTGKAFLDLVEESLKRHK
jgi:hypothetical protein